MNLNSLREILKKENRSLEDVSNILSMTEVLHYKQGSKIF
jgi:hypothetical protein